MTGLLFFFIRGLPEGIKPFVPQHSLENQVISGVWSVSRGAGSVCAHTDLSSLKEGNTLGD